MQTASEIEMIVLTGEQAGARRLLDNNTTFTISGNMDTDVVLRDPAIHDERVNLITKDSEVFLQVLSGDIEVQGKKVASGSIVKIPEYAKVKIGETTFSYGKNLSASWRDIVEYVSKIELTSSSRSILPVLHKSHYLILIVILLSLITVLVAYQYYRSISNQVETRIITNREYLHNYLTEKNYQFLSITESDTGQLVLSGFLMTNRELSKVESFVDTNRLPVLIDVSTGDHLAAEVRELYRVNGIDAEVKALEPGYAIVTTMYNDKNKLEKLKRIALSEIPSLIVLETEYSESIDKTETIQNTFYFNKEEKMITMVVDGTPSYVMTRDKSRYYVGAVLPTGHKIVSIIDKEVLLEKGGAYTTLQF